MRLPDRDILAVAPPGRTINIYAPSSMPEVEGAKLFDIPAIGIATLSEFDHRLPCDSLLKILTANNDTAQAVEDPDGACRVTWTYPVRPAGSAERTIWFDKQKGFCPVRLELVLRVPNSTHAEPEPLEWVSTAWSLVSGAWVPVRCEMHRRQPEAEIIADLDWDGANRPMSKALFEVSSFAASYTTVADHRHGDSRGVPIEAFDSASGTVGPLRAPVAWARFAMIAANVLVIVFLLGYISYRPAFRDARRDSAAKNCGERDS